MPEQDRAKIEEQVNVFRVEKRKFDMEISKWDDNGKYYSHGHIILKNQCNISSALWDEGQKLNVFVHRI